ncbi:MAK10-like protein [Tanacetum coccineum]
MATHTKRMEIFENAIFKQREEINGRMTEMFGLLKELMTSRTPKKVLIREESKFPVTKNVNSISLTKGEEERSNKTKVTPDNTKKPNETKTKMPVREAEAINGAENGAKNESIKTPENNEVVEASGSQLVTFNNSLSGTRVGKKKGKAYKVLPKGPIYEAILKKKITKKEDIGGNFEIPCSIGDLKHMNALVDQGSDIPYSTYMRLTDERPAETGIRLSLASHSYIYPLGIAEDVLVEVAKHVFPVEFVILDIKENEKRPFIFKIPFLTTAKATIKFDTSTITLRLVLEWEERIKLHLEKEMKFNQWRSNNFKNKQPTPIKVEGGMDDEGEVTYLYRNQLMESSAGNFSSKNKNFVFTERGDGVTIYTQRRHRDTCDGVTTTLTALYLMRRSLEVLRKFHWMILRGRFNQLSHVSSPLLSKPGDY